MLLLDLKREKNQVNKLLLLDLKREKNQVNKLLLLDLKREKKQVNKLLLLNLKREKPGKRERIDTENVKTSRFPFSTLNFMLIEQWVPTHKEANSYILEETKQSKIGIM